MRNQNVSGQLKPASDGQFKTGQTIRAAVAPDAARAVCADGSGRRAGSAGGFWPGCVGVG